MLTHDKLRMLIREKGIKHLLVRPRQTKKGLSIFFEFAYNFQGKRETPIVICKYVNANSLKKAIAQADYYNFLLAQEINPKEKESQEKINKTPLHTIFKEYRENPQTKDKKGFRRVELHIMQALGNKAISAITKDNIRQCLDKLHKENKRETLGRVYNAFKCFLEYCYNKDYISNDFKNKLGSLNLTALYGKVESKPFRAITDLKTFKELLHAIDNYQGSIYTLYALKISPYVALRDETMRNLKWEYIDFENKQINIPANIMKTKEEFIVPLSKQALKLFSELKPYSEYSAYCFPSDYSKSKCIGSNTLNLAIKRLGFGNEAVYHGFRTTFSTFAYENKKLHKQDSEVIELCLDHRERNKVKAVYNRSKRLEDRRKLMQWWSNFIDNLKESKQKEIA